jgi:O-antigen/teichoic acid export membrane protein
LCLVTFQGFTQRNGKLETKITDYASRYRKLAKNAGAVFSLRLVQRLCGIATTYFVVRALDQTLFGQYQFILTCLSLFAIFTLPGLNNSIAQSVARGFSGVYRQAVPRSLLCGLTGVVLLAGLGVYYRVYQPGPLVIGFFVAAGMFLFAFGLVQWKAVKGGNEDFVGILRLEGLAAVVQATLIILVVSIRPGNLLVPLVIYLGVQALLNILLTRATWRKISRDAPAEPGSLSYGTRITLYSAFNTVANHVDKLLVFFVLSPSSLAIFVAAERIPELTKGAVQDFAAVMGPRFARSSRYTRGLDNKLRLIGGMTSTLIVIMAFTVMPWLVTLIFGDTYRESIPYAQALMCSVAIGNVSTLRYRYVSSKLDKSSARLINIIMSVTRIAASAILVPLFGLTGAIISAFIYRITMSVIVHIVIRNRYLDAQTDD